MKKTKNVFCLISGSLIASGLEMSEEKKPNTYLPDRYTNIDESFTITSKQTTTTKKK